MKKLNLLVFLVMMSVFMSVVGVMAVTYDSTLILENKNSSWGIISDDIQANLSYNSTGPEFEYSLTATGLQPTTGYSLIYYADKQGRLTNWGGDNPGAFIAGGVSNGSGILTLQGSVNLGMNLPSEPDENIDTYNYCGEPDKYHTCHGAKIWLVPSSNYNSVERKVITWNSTAFLFETDLIHYNYSVSQGTEGDLLDVVSISVTPSTLNFGAIPRGTDIIKEAINNPVNINTTGSDTEFNNTYIYLSIADDTENFYTNLLEIEVPHLSNLWYKLGNWTGYLTLPEKTANNPFKMRLHGNTLGYSSGPKTATIVYTAYGEHL